MEDNAIYVLNGEFDHHSNIFGSLLNSSQTAEQMLSSSHSSIKTNSNVPPITTKRKILLDCGSCIGSIINGSGCSFGNNNNNNNNYNNNPNSSSSIFLSSGLSPSVTTPVTSGNILMKKNSNIKSTIIAKKEKFWKYLEEEKWKNNSIENVSNEICEKSSIESTSSSSSSSSSSKQINNNSNKINSNDNRYSNPFNNIELYREAAELLGLSCTLCDNCRCIDCQSNYFECDDSDNSEIDNFDEFNDYNLDEPINNFIFNNSKQFFCSNSNSNVNK